MVEATGWVSAAAGTGLAAVLSVRTILGHLKAEGGGGTPTMQGVCGSEEAASGLRGEDEMADLQAVRRMTGATSRAVDVGERIAAVVTAGSRGSHGNVGEEVLLTTPRNARRVAQPASVLKTAPEAPI